MAGYFCPSCGKNSKLPDYCCGESMIQQDDNCKDKTKTAQDCNTPKRK